MAKANKAEHATPQQVGGSPRESKVDVVALAQALFVKHYVFDSQRKPDYLANQAFDAAEAFANAASSRGK